MTYARTWQYVRVVLVLSACTLWGGMPSLALGAALNEECTVSLQNRTVQVGADGTFAFGNIPVDEGFYRLRAVCRRKDGTIETAQSAFFRLTPANEPLEVHSLSFGVVDPIPVSLRMDASRTTFNARGETVQLAVTGVLPDGRQKELSSEALGTSYTTSNPGIATVSGSGLVTAISRGRVVISARNEGVLVSLTMDVVIPNDADGDGMPDEFERVNGLNPNDGTDAALDPDQDGLTNLQEFQHGTSPLVADTDGDRVSDGAEVKAGTNPLLADTDGDGLADGQEAIRHTNPLNPDTDGDGLPDGLEVRLGLNPLVVDPVTTVQGRIVDEHGTPVPGGSAVAFNAFVATADDTGRFSIPRVPAGLGPVVVVAGTIRAGQVVDGSSLGIVPVSGVTDIGTIQIGVNAGTVSGLVTDPAGQSVPGALVTLTAGGDVRTTFTDPAGRYRVANMVTGSITVTVRDPRTLLRGRAAGAVSPIASTTLDVRLGPWGSVVGMVFGRDGSTPLGAGVAETLSGPTFLTARSDPSGHYAFDFVPLGSLILDAADGTGNRARSPANLTATSEIAVADLTFLARGQVVGVVRNAVGVPVPNASVTLNSHGVFGGVRTAVTDGEGRYAVNDFFIGPFDVLARAPIARLAGSGSGIVLREGQQVTVDIELTPAGTFQGTVFHHGGTVPVPGATVSLPGLGLSSTADSQGRYRIDVIPVGTYILYAAESGTGDRGLSGGAIHAQDEVVTADITLNGQGRVVVTVRDAGDALVPGANVSVTSLTPWGDAQRGATQPNGVITFDRVLAGDFEVQAVEPTTQLQGFARDSVDVGAAKSVTVHLQAAGTIVGKVFAPNGTTPVPNLSVVLAGPVSRQTSTGADGSFRFDIVPVGQYRLDAIDSAGSLRARATGVILSTHREVVQRDLTLIGVGTVQGQVTLPDGTAGAGVGVSVSSQAPGFGRSFFARTDVNGHYSVLGVPIGGIVASASSQGSEGQLYGQGTGQLGGDGDSVTINIRLAANNLYDASNFAYFVRNDGSIRDGTRQFFAGDSSANSGGFLLDLVAGGIVTRFAGTPDVVEENGRELVFRQSGLAGLDVTRKIFVPRTGYFARYLEVLRNPSDQPVTVDVRVTTHFRFIQKVQGGFTFDREPRVISTSSGDALLDVSDPQTADRWVVIDDDDDGDTFLINTLPPVAHVFDGQGAFQTARVAGLETDFTNRFGQLTEEWSNVTVPAGGMVAFLHFTSQQTSRAGAQASAERLVQLPPEALIGLSPDELGAIRNFVVPAGGQSTLPALPSLNGAVTGRVLASDAVTPIPGTQVSYRSNHPLFGRTHFVNANTSGSFRLDAAFNVTGTSVAIPVAPFTLGATHPETGIQAPATLGDFASGLTVAQQDLVFSNSGMITGLVRRFTGAVVSGGTIQITGDALLRQVTTGIGTGGTFRFTGVPPGSYVMTAAVPHPQGTSLSGTTSISITEGHTTTAEITLPPTGLVTGVLRRATGEAVVDLRVNLRGAGDFTRVVRTDTGGRFTFSDLPEGTVTVEAFEALTNTAASAQAIVIADRTVTTDLTLSVGGTVAGQVMLPNGQPAAGAAVIVTAANGSFSTSTGADGRYSVDHITPGAVVVEAGDAATGLRGRATGSLGLSGQMLGLDVSLFVSGHVTGAVFRAGGSTPAPGVQVSIDRSLHGLPTTVTTDVQGHYSFDLVPLGTFTVEVTELATGDRGRSSNQISSNGEIRTINVPLNGLGRVELVVRDASGNLVANADVTVSSQTAFDQVLTGRTGTDGTFAFADVLAGDFTVSATDPLTRLGGSVRGNVGVGATANLTVSLQPAGTIVGRLFGPDGTTPAGVGRTVRLVNGDGVWSQTSSATDGSFRFDAVPLGTYTLESLDNGRVRTRETGLTLVANGEVLTRNLTLVGIGVVTGRVLSPSGSPMPNLEVTLRSGNLIIGGFLTGTTDASGLYRITFVPAGIFAVSASSGGALGEGASQIDQDGQEVNIDIQLANNAVTLPVTQYDANNALFDVQGSGGILNGINSVFGGDFDANQGGLLLDVITGGSPVRFTGGTVGNTEESGREIAVRQQNLAGLDVTRKVFVPVAGYFARYLEILSNPTANPITVDVRVLTNLRSSFNGLPRIINTSSGDASLDVSSGTPDRWIVVDDDTDDDPFLTWTLPAMSFTFDGPGARDSVAAVHLATPSASFGQLTYQWNGVMIPPGGTVAFLHFAAQQIGRAAAQAAANRLAQLPPEALAGLSATEIGSIRNFNVPSDGTSPLVPLPTLNGTVNGRVLASDGVTALANASVRFRSRNILFGRTQSVSTNAGGLFNITSTLNNSGNSRAIPADGFVLQAWHPGSGVPAPDIFGDFPAGLTTAVQDIIFSNTGLVRGTVRRHSGATVPSGQVQITGASSEELTTSGDGSYLATGLLPGNYVINVNVPHPDGTGLTGIASTSVSLGGETIADITIEGTGTLMGIVRSAEGLPTSDVVVELTGSSFYRSVRTNSTGSYLFTDVPLGVFTARASEPRTNVPTSATLTIAQDTTTVQDLTLIGLGTAQVQVNFARGSPAPNSDVRILESARGSFRVAGSTDSQGRVTIDDVTAGDFKARVFHPQNGSLFKDVDGEMATGQTIAISVALPAVATVQATVLNNSQTPVAGAAVRIRDSKSSAFRVVGIVDSLGKLDIPNVPEGDFSIQAREPGSEWLGGTVGTVRADQDGQIVPVSIIADPGIGVIRYPAERDLWVVNGSANQVLSVALDGAANQDLPAMANTVIEIYSPDGALLAISDDSSPSRNSFVNVTLVQSGQHTIVARGSAGAVGGYRLTCTLAGDNVVPQLYPGGAVGGRVLQADGVTAIPNIRVRLVTTNGPQLEANVLTNSVGEYIVPGVPFGPFGNFSVTGVDANGVILASTTGNVARQGEVVVADIRRACVQACSDGQIQDPLTCQCAISDISVTAGTYGGNCGAAYGNVTLPIRAACNGKASCDYVVDYSVLGDPVPFCAKDYIAEWTCSGTVNMGAYAIPPEAGFGSVAHLMCPVSSDTIHIVAGTYGSNCTSSSVTNVTEDLTLACDGKAGNCSYFVSAARLGDPSVGCAKSYIATWMCGSSSTPKSVVVSPEADGKTVQLSCP